VNIIGHNYIASKVLNRYNSLIAAGCHLPDLVPFLRESVLTFDEIHESPERVYDYLKQNDDMYIDLALGLMTHSVKFGADKFNKEIDTWLLESNENLKLEIANKIVGASNMKLETALGPRMHNYLWCGYDFYILDKYPTFVNRIGNAYSGINVSEISEIISKTFDKPQDTIQNNIEAHIGLVLKHNVATREGYISLWNGFASQLPEKDKIDELQALNTVVFIENIFQNQWGLIENRVVADITSRMAKYL
jgi:hypothetical protein